MEDIKSLLGDLAPQNPQQEAVFKEAINKILRKVASEKRKRLTSAVYKDGYSGLFMANKGMRELTDGFSKDRELRHIATIPVEMVEIAKKIYGDDVLTNKKKFREAFVKNSEGQYCLTVRPDSI